MKNSKIQKLKKRGSTLLLLVLFMCVLATVVAVVLVSSPAVDRDRDCSFYYLWKQTVCSTISGKSDLCGE